MSLLQETKTVTLDGQDFRIGMLPYSKARGAFFKIAGAMDLNAEVTAAMGTTFFAIVNDVLSEADVAFINDLFGSVSVAVLDADRELPLNTEINRDKVFTGRIDLAMEWLDACIEYNFGNAKKKLTAGASVMRRQIAEKQAELTRA
ncbi:MAG TPA: hypothetical protein VFZ53_05215 [Polyangiaceae bacterium]